MALPLMGMSSFNITVPAPRRTPSEHTISRVPENNIPSATSKSSSGLSSNFASEMRSWARKRRRASPRPFARYHPGFKADAAEGDIHDDHSSVPSPVITDISSSPETPFVQTPALLSRPSEFGHIYPTTPSHIYPPTQPLSIRKRSSPNDTSLPSDHRFSLSSFHSEYTPSFISMASTHLYLYPWNDYNPEAASTASVWKSNNFYFDDSDTLMHLAFSRSFDDLLQTLDEEIESNRADRREWRENAEEVLGQTVDFWEDQAFM